MAGKTEWLSAYGQSFSGITETIYSSRWRIIQVFCDYTDKGGPCQMIMRSNLLRKYEFLDF
jgi:hypothetical protein